MLRQPARCFELGLHHAVPPIPGRHQRHLLLLLVHYQRQVQQGVEAIQTNESRPGYHRCYQRLRRCARPRHHLAATLLLTLAAIVTHCRLQGSEQSSAAECQPPRLHD